MAESSWYHRWFDSPYYHLLYKNRNNQEARNFIDNLLLYLKPKTGSRFLDLACGWGRHSTYLNSKGFEVDGIDLSETNIAEAKKHESESLHFALRDIRKPYKENTFNYALNLFTSLGYFNNKSEDVRVLKNVNSELKSDGELIVDYLNARKIISDLIKKEEIFAGEIKFHIRRELIRDQIIKHIEFTADGKEHHFAERVRAYELADFKQMLFSAGFEIVNTFGNYELAPFDEYNSLRLIIHARKMKP